MRVKKFPTVIFSIINKNLQIPEPFAESSRKRPSSIIHTAAIFITFPFIHVPRFSD